MVPMIRAPQPQATYRIPAIAPNGTFHGWKFAGNPGSGFVPWSFAVNAFTVGLFPLRTTVALAARSGRRPYAIAYSL